MRIEAAGQGQFREVVLRPRVTVAAGAHLPGAATSSVLAASTTRRTSTASSRGR